MIKNQRNFRAYIRPTATGSLIILAMVGFSFSIAFVTGIVTPKQVFAQVAPPSCTLTASPSDIQAGQSTTLNWTTANATQFDIDHGVGSLFSWTQTPLPSGSVTVSPTVTTTYTGTVADNGGFSPHRVGTCSVTVTVTTPPPPSAPPSCTLSAAPSTIQAGQSTTLNWTTANAT